ncbi:hypothetical protein Asal01_00176 [Fodinibius salicampi]
MTERVQNTRTKEVEHLMEDWMSHKSSNMDRWYLKISNNHYHRQTYKHNKFSFPVHCSY